MAGRLLLARVYVRPLMREAASFSPPEGIEMRLATADDLATAVREMPEHISAPFVEAANQRGDLCAAAFDGPRMVSFVWRSFSTAPHLVDLWVAFEKPYRYGYKAYTDPAYRGRHLQNPIRLLADELSMARGFEYAISFIETHNYPSIVAELRRGNRCVGFAGYLRLFGKTFPFASPGARKHTFRFYRREAAPV